MLKRIFFGCGISVVLCVLVGYVVLEQKVASYLSQKLDVSRAELISVRQGQSLRSTLISLEHQHWIKSSVVSHVVYRFFPQFAKIKAGTYQVQAGDTLRSVLEKFVAGDEHQFSITLIEGSRFEDWRVSLAAAKYLKHDTAGMTEQQIAQRLSIPHTRLEGMFLAETYHYTQGTSDLDILKLAHEKLMQILNKAWEMRDRNLPVKSPYEALILASIIEKETGISSERKRIASVFINRLNKNMRLQTDPTVIYGMGANYDGNIRKKDLLTPTPYNTYVIRGLPPTPIAAVGRASLEAVFNPESSQYLYFVASGHGGHVFSKSLAEHNRAVHNYLKQLRKK